MREKIFAAIEETLGIPTGTITDNTKIEDVEQWDSLAHVMIIGSLEERLGIEISMGDAAEMTTVKDILDYVNKEA